MQEFYKTLIPRILCVVALAISPETIGSPPQPPGYKLTPVHGDMTKEGVYCIRLNMPAGMVLEPHCHPLDQCVTVLKGKLVIGYGEKFDFAKSDTIREDGFVVIPANKIHFENFPEGALVQIHGPGPLKTEKVKSTK